MHHLSLETKKIKKRAVRNMKGPNFNEELQALTKGYIDGVTGGGTARSEAIQIENCGKNPCNKQCMMLHARLKSK